MQTMSDHEFLEFCKREYLPPRKMEEAIMNGANVNAKDGDGWTALMMVVLVRNSMSAEILLKHGADVNAKNKDGTTALMMADTNESAARVLLAYGADVNAKDKDGWTALMRAVRSDDKGVTKLLLSHGADVNARGNDRDSAGFWIAYPPTVFSCAKNQEMRELLGRYRAK